MPCEHKKLKQVDNFNMTEIGRQMCQVLGFSEHSIRSLKKVNYVLAGCVSGDKIVAIK